MGHGRVWTTRKFARGDGTYVLATWPVRHTDHNELTWRAFRDGKCGLEGPDFRVFVCLTELGEEPQLEGGMGRGEAPTVYMSSDH